MTGGVQIELLPDGRRLHLNHGPIDLIIEAFGAADEIERAYRQAAARFDGLLEALVAELPLLRRPIGVARPRPQGPVAGRMVAAVWPHRRRYVTPMAAVAGAVADEILAAMVAGRSLERAYVNDGGDIALYLTPGRSLTAGLVGRVEQPALDGTCEIAHDLPVRGIATSGRGGRSLSRGIADSVTVLAADGAAADAAATLIANGVDLDHPAIRRAPAVELDPDSDLGELPVTVAVGQLTPAQVAEALAAGAALAEEMLAAGLIHGAAMTLQGDVRVVGAALSRALLPREAA
jgi:ApbE superfamily uncharacterized protein (UPF0280 family)